jgi:transcription elongation GreA/GreB family factor
MDKIKIIEGLKNNLETKLNNLFAELKKAGEDAAGETKSAMGDKYETGRATIQQYIDKIDGQIKIVKEQLGQLDRASSQKTSDKISLNSLVETDRGLYFISIGLGMIDLFGNKIAVISPSSPVGKALLGKKVGETAVFNGRKIEIRTIL